MVGQKTLSYHPIRVESQKATDRDSCLSTRRSKVVISVEGADVLHEDIY
jgi:hypothetical protein